MIQRICNRHLIKSLYTIVILLLICMVGVYIIRNKDSQDECNKLLKDYDLLWQTLEDEYVFFPYIEEKGIDLVKLKAKYREMVGECGDNIFSFSRTLDKMFIEMGNLGHLGVLDPRGFEVYKEYLHDEYRAMLDNKKVIETYTSVLPAYSKDNTTSLSNVSFHYDDKINAAIIKIRSFDVLLTQSDHNQIVDYLNSVSKKQIKNIVFDITGNPGGSDGYWRDNIVSIFGGEYEWENRIFVKDTSFARKYYLNNMYFKPISDLQKELIPEFVSKLELTDYIVMKNSIHGRREIENTICDVKRWVLIDKYVYSASESFVTFLKKTGWAETVGTKTKGDGLGSTPLLFMLQNSGLLIKFEILCPENSSGELSIVSGTVPDYVSNIKETPYDTLKRIIKIANPD